MKTFAIAAASFGLIATSAPALADTVEQNSETISIAGLDLSTAEGQEMLDRRIDRVARTVCGVGKTRTGTRIPSHSARTCYEKAVVSAKEQVAAMIESAQRGG
ncbi:UrcA family protein [Erythrobacter rubeus]|uniref:UrcA family protein n=1 Tax=Erythrobacter rubeus TaxID=2760803 RepID=A0ABR8KXL3_9SPHN|nr:UrcA family protein [Erythrobacter rubeus]MBD2843184.1 UrcA family protein [Erythrobacter rubeus]